VNPILYRLGSSGTVTLKGVVLKMINREKVFRILFAVIFICSYPLAFDADIYTWADENGITP
jgi:hypothetical protein